MKTKTLLLIVSAMVFGTALLMGVAIIAILFIIPNNNTPGAMSEQSAEQNNNQQLVSTGQANFVYLFQSQTNTLTRVSMSDGSSQDFSLGLPTGDTAWVNRLSFSDDGRLLAFCPSYRESDTLVTHRLIVRDIAAESNVIAIPFGNIPACQSSDFNDDGTEIAVGLIFNSIIEGAVNFPDEPNWALRTYDIATGDITHELNADSPNAPDYESMTTDFWFEDGISAMTRAVSFTDTEILMTAFPYVGRDGPLRVPAHRWNLQTDTVTPVDGLTRLGASYLAPTGEIVYPYLDESFEAASPPGPMPQANTIRIDDNGDIRTIYRNSDYIIANTSFINGGRQIAVMLVGAYDENNPGEIGASRYEIINRDGSLGQISSGFISYNQMYGTSNGMIMLSVDQLGAEGNRYQLVHYVDGQAQTLWSLDASPQTWLEFAWAPPMPIASDLQAFAVVN